jgi:hypothetical protein
LCGFFSIPAIGACAATRYGEVALAAEQLGCTGDVAERWLLR